MTKNVNTNFEVDAVITWVDGNDAQFQKKIAPFLKKNINWSNKKETIRYQSIDEIDIAIKSIIKFAPFISTIFLVTDNQIPKSFESLKSLSVKSGMNLKVIDHKEIFKSYENNLPTFNSCSIGTMLFRIEGLAEHFLVFNDDTFLMRETKVSDYFRNGKPIIRGKWDKFYEDKQLRKIYNKVRGFLGYKRKSTEPGYKRAQQTSARVLGFENYIKRDHTPVSLRKSTIQKFFTENDTLLKKNIRFKFRNENQFIISSLANHLEVKLKSFYLENRLDLTYFQSYKYLFIIRFKLYLFSINKNKKFMCFQNLEIAEEKQLNFILVWLDKRLGII